MFRNAIRHFCDNRSAKGKLKRKGSKLYLQFEDKLVQAKGI